MQHAALLQLLIAATCSAATALIAAQLDMYCGAHASAFGVALGQKVGYVVWPLAWAYAARKLGGRRAHEAKLACRRKAI